MNKDAPELRSKARKLDNKKGEVFCKDGKRLVGKIRNLGNEQYSIEIEGRIHGDFYAPTILDFDQIDDIKPAESS